MAGGGLILAAVAGVWNACNDRFRLWAAARCITRRSNHGRRRRLAHGQTTMARAAAKPSSQRKTGRVKSR
jgi:hypothetical protein